MSYALVYVLLAFNMKAYFIPVKTFDSLEQCEKQLEILKAKPTPNPDKIHMEGGSCVELQPPQGVKL